MNICFGEHKSKYMPLKSLHSTFAPTYTWTSDNSLEMMLGTWKSHYCILYLMSTIVFSFKMKGNKVPVFIMIAKSMEIEATV
jgi:hypothetical protein